MREVDWSHRLIGIKGSRRIGKTTFLLQYAKEHFGTDRRCLYVNFNNFYFSNHTLINFAEQFYNEGGRTLLLDQVFKYENWSKELRECYDRFPELHIVFAGSTVMRLKEGNDDLKDVVASYSLQGFSFREFINLQAGTSLSAYTLKDITTNHEEIAKYICSKVQPLDFFQSYLHHGYYPFFLEKQNFSENLIKTMNMMLEVDVLLIKKIELKYLPKIRKLLYLLMLNAPMVPNISQLSKEIETSRATIMNYVKYLKDARLLSLLYTNNDTFLKKPSHVYVHNTNLMHAVNPGKVDKTAEYKTFLYNSLNSKHKINLCKSQTGLCVDEHYYFKFDSKNKHKYNPETFYAIDGIEIGSKNEIPLWLFGFLY